MGVREVDVGVGGGGGGRQVGSREVKMSFRSGTCILNQVRNLNFNNTSLLIGCMKLCAEIQALIQ